MVEKIQALPKELGRVRRILADAGYLSEVNVERCEAAKIEPLIAAGSQKHYVSWKQRFAAAPRPLPGCATPLQRMAVKRSNSVTLRKQKCHSRGG
jgi:hypothetical protein